MSNLSAAQIAAVAQRAGFRGEGLVKAVAVALAESGGNPRAVGVNSDRYRSRDRGLWQINSHWHPEITDAAAFNPVSCAAAAYKISSHGTNWSPWSTWKNGAAAAQMGRARIAAARPSAAGGGGATATPAGFLPDPGTLGGIAGGLIGGIPGAVAGGLAGSGNGVEAGKALIGTGAALADIVVMWAKAGAWIADSHNWSRVALVGGGSIGVLISLSMIGKSGAAGSTAGAVVGSPVHAVTGAAKLAGTAAAAVATDGVSLAAKGAKAVTK